MPKPSTTNNHAELVERLSDGIAALTTSDAWERYLDCQSRFHRYSFGNTVLILLQRPTATQVAGVNAWRKLGRTVRKGEKALWILAPMVYKRTEDSQGQREDGQGEKNATAVKVVAGFKYVPVFDLFQTDGEDLPTVCNKLGGDDPTGSFDTLVGVATSLGYVVELAELSDGVNGDCTYDLARIRVEMRNSPAQQLKTLAHELAHAALHQGLADRRLAELEAESVAYVVCQSLGVDSGDYSFGYVATWAGGAEQARAGIKASGERIQKTAAALLAPFEAQPENAQGEAA